MASFIVTMKGVATQATNPASSQSKGLPIGVNLCELVSSCRQLGRGSCSPLTSTGTQHYQVESAVSIKRSKARSGSNLETRCHLATDKESVREEDSASSDTALLAPKENWKPLSRLSHFLGELAQQDVWAGLLDPFQTAGGNTNEVNYFIQDLKLRNASKADASTLGAVSQIPVSVDEEQSPLSPRVSCYPDSDGVLHLGTRIDVASVTSKADLLSYAIDAATGAASGNGTYAKINGHLMSDAPTSSPSTGSNGLGTPMQATSTMAASHVRIDVPQAELCHESATCVTAAIIGSVDNLARWLEERIGVETVSQWGIAPGTKHVSNLWCELVEGEISLEDSTPPKRSTHVTSVKIKNDEGHVLVEAYQEMADGRRRPRNRPLSEKMRPGEQVEEACLRGIFEELGGQLGARDRVMLHPESYIREEEERESCSYPGLPTRYIIHSMDAHIQQLPTAEFYTEEDESGHGGSAAGVAALNGSSSQKKAVGVKKHFWRWVPENRLAELCKK